jgi:hypothetical protein
MFFVLMCTLPLSASTYPPGTGPPLTNLIGTVITVSNTPALNAAVSTANAGGSVTILLADNTYNLTISLNLAENADNVIVRSLSGNRDNVVLNGGGMASGLSHVFLISGTNVTIADVTLGWVANHGIQVRGEVDADGLRVHNVRFVDIYEQMLKGSVSGNGLSADNGIVEYCTFEFSSGQSEQYYTGGIDVHRGKNWRVRNNLFRNIRSPSAEAAEHAVHFWDDSGNVIVERNIIINCDRGIGFGLGSQGHSGGIIRNNMIYNNGAGNFDDVGIGLENAGNVDVLNNTVCLDDYWAAIEYRFTGTTGGTIINNLCNQQIARRDGGSATLSHNITGAESTWFINYTAGDLHLNTTITQAIDRAQSLAAVPDDIDEDIRPIGPAPDIGADEVIPEPGITFTTLLLLLTTSHKHKHPTQLPHTPKLVPGTDY